MFYFSLLGVFMVKSNLQMLFLNSCLRIFEKYYVSHFFLKLLFKYNLLFYSFLLFIGIFTTLHKGPKYAFILFRWNVLKLSKHICRGIFWPSQTQIMELVAVNYFYQKAPSKILNRIANTSEAITRCVL